MLPFSMFIIFLLLIWSETTEGSFNGIIIRTDCDEEQFPGSCPDGTGTLAVIVAVAALLLMILVVVFVPLHYWLWGCCRRCFLREVTLDEDPGQ